MIVVPELRELLARIDPTPDSAHDSGVTDWADLDDRVHFIADMFRCFQESQFLFDPPFSRESSSTGSRPGSGRPNRSDTQRGRSDRLDYHPAMATNRADRALSWPLGAALTFVAAASVLVLEIAAGRLLAPTSASR